MSFRRSVSLKQLALSCMWVMMMLASRAGTIKLIQSASPDHKPKAGQLLSIPNIEGSNDDQLVLIANALNTSAPILRSDDGSYAWQFVPYNQLNNESSRLLTVLNTANTAYNTTIIWIANRNHPVSPNASLFVKLPSRIFLLQDADGSIAWSPPIENIHTIVMNSTGNLIMYDAHNATIWQSFDNAFDVLVPGQIIKTHHSVVSRLSIDDVSEGHYTVRMEPGGAVLYASFDWQQHMVPYTIVNYAAQGTDYSGSAQVYKALHSACNHTNLLYKMGGTGIALQQEAGSFISPQCREEVGAVGDDTHGIDFGTRLGGIGFRFLRLMPYGDIDSYLSTNSGVYLDNQFFGGMFLSFCRLPSYCGINSLCTSRDDCSCPDLFKPISGANARLGCQLIEPLNCSIYSQHQFLPMAMVDYYANAHLPAPVVSSPEECQSSCRANCSCTTAFYNNMTRQCHLYDQVQTMLPGSDPSMTAYLRVAKLPFTSPSARSSIPKKTIIGVTTGVATLVLISVLFVGWIGRRIVKKTNEESDSEEEAFLESLPGLPPRFTYKELHSATEGFSKKLGTGGSGTVYEGHVLPAEIDRNIKQLVTKTPMQQDSLLKVAVKELQLSRFATIAASGKKQFRAEVAALGSLSHVNLVQLRGFCAEGAHRLLIYEFLYNGSLDRWIFNSVSPLQWEVRYRIAIDTAKGLAFLHEGSRDKVVHLDVKPQNILLDANFRAKLADFGLCKLVERDSERGAGAESQTVTAMRGTPGYMAPEWFLNLPVTDRSDVFSYGMVLLELVGGRKNLNLAAGSEDDQWYFPAWAVQQAENGNLLDVIDQELTEDESPHAMCSAMTRLLHVAFWCIQENAGSRPSMSTVLLMLEEHLQVPDPPLDQTYILRRQSRPYPTLTFASTTNSSSSTSTRACTLASDIISELEPR